ncbi:MAG TPA: TonB-dependent receptor plug domain-containing protein, partial [Polyangiaceae bacterium]|nr:TonB-dependent receptor plug domain-containing protein [Polyangiaceae bacterium]
MIGPALLLVALAQIGAAGDAAPAEASAAPTASEPSVDDEAALAAALSEEDPAGDASIAEVIVKTTPSEARRRQESAEAVHVVNLSRARQQTSDLGEALARTPGVGVRRNGGLGSDATLSLNGLQGDQVRVFLDGVPLQFAGYPAGAINIPVNLIEHLDVYRGVVPISFGADALGGAINLVTNQSDETRASGSYQVGSFGTLRATLNGRHRHEPSGALLGASAFFDSARNDYWMDDRPLPTPEGGTVYRTLRRFHDGYRAYGGNIEAGVVDRAWARRLLVQAFFSSYDKELQHNAVMSVPYGEVTYGESIYGASAR